MISGAGAARRRRLRLVTGACAGLVAAGCGARLTPAQHAAGVRLAAPRADAAQAPAQGAAASTAAAVAPGPVPTQAAAAGLPAAGVPTGPVTTVGAAAPTTSVAGPTIRASVPASASSSARTAGSCAGGSLSATDTGVTPTTVTVNNSADLTGPVPGLFQTAQDGVKAFVAYFNGTGQTICGRRLALTNLDSQSSEAGDNEAATNACANAFAMVGGDSAFDQGGAPVVQRCGIPDIRATVNSVQRGAVPNVVAASSDDLHWFEPSIAAFFAQKYGDKLTQHAAIAYINVGVGEQQAKRYKAGFESQGWKVVDVLPIDVSDFSYDVFAQKMKGDGVDFVFFIAAEAQYARMAHSFTSQGFHPDAFLVNPNGYDSVYTDAAGADGKGTYVYIDSAPFDEAATNSELQLYLTWLGRVAPNAQPSWFGELAWSAARLFATLAQQVGPDLTRKAFVTKLRQVSGWTSNGLTSPQPIGAKTTGSCWAIIQWDGTAWQRASPAPYTCTPAAMPVSYS